MPPDPRPKRKRFGQHFLHDRGYVDRIVKAISPRENDIVVEIGPGGGVLTKPLSTQAGRLIAVEIDRDLAAHLRHVFASNDNVSIVEADALAIDFANFGERLRVVGNLPYNISTPLLFRLTAQRQYVSDAVFMLQKEVVDRIVAVPGNKTYGRLSVMLQCYWHVEALFRVPAGAFQPPPRVESAIVRLSYRDPVIDAKHDSSFETLVRTAFGQRRKTLRRSLAPLMSEQAIRQCDIDPSVRPETLAVEDFARLSLQC